jgi:serine/threonine-protein kinase
MEPMHPGVPETRERRVGRYTLHGEIASGGMATVHFGRLAGEGGFSRIVAIKCMHRHLADDPEFRAMFLDEARLAARIRHPNVVSTIDVGSSEDGMFLVMEYVTGESLAALLRAATKRGEPIPVSISIRIVIDALYGLHAAHIATDDAGAPLHIVHRDVSPQNILVATDGHARVLDFGIAKAAGRSHTTRDGQLKGKFRYMAPEQVRDSPVSPRTDVYAASVVLWELLAGQQLFRGSNDAAVVARVLEGVVPPPSKLVPALPPELDAVVLRGLEREPDRRFESAEAMAEALEALSHSTTARQVGIWVGRLAGAVLRARAEQIASFEGVPSTSGLVRAQPVVPPASEESRSSASTLTMPQPEPKTEVSAATPPSAAPAPARKRGVPVLAALLGTTVVGALAGLAFVGAQRSHRDAAAAAAGAATPASASPSAAPSTAASVEPAPAIAASVVEEPEQPRAAASASAPAPSVRPHRPAQGGHGSPAGAPVKANCTPPYYQDPSGIRHVKPECL